MQPPDRWAAAAKPQLSTISEVTFASKSLRLHPDDPVTLASTEANVSLITPLITYARNGHLVPALTAEMLALERQTGSLLTAAHLADSPLPGQSLAATIVADPWMLGLCGPNVPWSIPLAVRPLSRIPDSVSNHHGEGDDHDPTAEAGHHDHSAAGDDHHQGTDAQLRPVLPDFCIPPPPPDLDCADVNGRNFTVLPPDPHGFDREGDGLGCES